MWEVIEKAKKANKPLDASAMTEMDVELDRLQFKGARDVYNNVVGVMKTDREVCMLMA